MFLLTRRFIMTDMEPPVWKIHYLPDTCLLVVFNYLSTPELVNVSLTCRKFYNFLQSTRSVFNLLDFRCLEGKMTSIPTKGIWSNVACVKFLSLRFCTKIQDFSSLKHMTRLDRLDLFCTDVTDEDLSQNIPYKLTRIDLGYCEHLKSSQVIRKFLLERPNLQMIGLAALDEVVNDEVSVIRMERISLASALAKRTRKSSPQVSNLRELATPRGQYFGALVMTT